MTPPMSDERLEELRQIAAVHPRSDMMDELCDEITRLRSRIAELEAELKKWNDRHREDMSYHGGNHSSKPKEARPAPDESTRLTRAVNEGIMETTPVREGDRP